MPQIMLSSMLGNSQKEGQFRWTVKSSWTGYLPLMSCNSEQFILRLLQGCFLPVLKNCHCFCFENKPLIFKWRLFDARSHINKPVLKIKILEGIKHGFFWGDELACFSVPCRRLLCYYPSHLLIFSHLLILPTIFLLFVSYDYWL